MKKSYLLLIILCFTTLFGFSQDINRIEVFGKIIVDSVDVEGVTIYNKSSNKGTITNIEGKFSIEVALNDRVEVSALQFEKFVIVITEEIIDSKIITVFLVKRMNKLDEIIILPYGLSGNLLVDMESVKTFNPDLDALYFGIQNSDKYEFTDDYKSEVVNEAIQKGYYYNGADVIAIVGLILSPIFKSKTKNLPKNNNAYQELTDKYSLSYLVKNLDIPEESAFEFVYFVEDNGFDKNLLKAGNELQFLDFLIEKSKAFKKIKNDEKD